MRKNPGFRINLIFLGLIIGFIVVYLIFITEISTFNTGLNYSITIFIGFALLIGLLFYLFLYLDHDENSQFHLKTRGLNEKHLILILVSLMLITYNIPSVEFSDMIIDWNQIPIMNYFRAVIFIIGTTFIPGACIFKLFFPRNPLPKMFKIEPFFIKIVIYPLISFAFLGASTLILDQIGVSRPYFSLSLLLIILSLFIMYTASQILRKQSIISFKHNETKISQYTIFILLVIASILIITIGINEGPLYVRDWDSYVVVKYTNFIGKAGNKVSEGFYGTYATYWSYIIFGLSDLCGIPIINVNTLLFPYNYLFVASIYLLFKAFLKNWKEIYAVLATIIAITFSSLFDIYHTYTRYEQVSFLTFEGIFNFRYKSLGIDFFILSMALLIIALRNIDFKIQNETISKKNSSKTIFFSAFLLIQGYMIYFFPGIPGLLLYFFLIFIFAKKKQLFKFYLIFSISFLSIFTLFDFLTSNLISYIPSRFFTYFLRVPLISSFDLLGYSILTYSSLFIYLLLCLISFRLYWKLSSRGMKNKRKIKGNSNFIFQMIFLVFSGLLMLNLILNYISTIRSLNYFTYILFLIFLYSGYMGILGFYSSYFLFKENKRLFYTLMAWLLFLLMISLIVIFANWVKEPKDPPQYYDGLNNSMLYWFSRTWYYTIIPLSVFAVYGLLKIKNIIDVRSINKKLQNKILSFIFACLLIVSSFSNTILAAIEYQNHYTGLSNQDAQVVGWISSNVPGNANLLVDFYSYKFIDVYLDVNTFLISNEIENALNSYECWSIDRLLDPNCTIQLMQQPPEVKTIKMTDNNSNGKIFSLINFNESRSFGTVQYLFKTSNASNRFLTNYSSFDHKNGISIHTFNNSIYYYNGTDNQKILDIQNSYWYNISLNYECTEGNFSGLGKYRWNIYINGSSYGEYKLTNNISSISYMTLESSILDDNWNMYLKNIKFLWAPDFHIEYCFFQSLLLLNHLNNQEIYYIILPRRINEFRDDITDYSDIVSEFLLLLEEKIVYEYGQLAVYKLN